MRTLQDLFLDELADIYDAERRTAKALPRMAKAATNEKLKALLLSQLKEAGDHGTKIETVFACFATKVRVRPCSATASLIEEGDELLEDYTGSPAVNAALIFLMQKIAHHEIAQYGCLHEWATLLGDPKAADLLQEILDEEKAANDALTNLARKTCNKEALAKDARKDADKLKPAGKKSAASVTAPLPSATNRKTAPSLA